jgi:UDP-N-acetylglucosamine--N-acetylmuramyl-(pentapeptide) pyrophosphoryl-undecaprenol N-acetylglucosamine transferase
MVATTSEHSALQSGAGRTPGTPRILFACGGTGGHVYPAIAIADQVKAIAPEAAIAFAGTRDRMEWEAVPKAGYPIHAVTVSGFQRGFSLEAIARNSTFTFRLAKGLWDSLRLIRGFDADVIVGTGGYVAGPVGFAAAMLARPVVLQEQNAYAGATNRLLARFASRIFTAFEAADAYFPSDRTELAGNPVRADLTEASAAEARAHFEVAEGQTVLLAMGGSLGAGPINAALQTHLNTLLAREDLTIIWQTGGRYFDAIRPDVPDHPRLRLLPYLDRMDLAYAVADVALTRAGAITCSELALTRTPAVLIPSPNVTADHQTKNARAMADAGAAVLLPEGEIEAGFLPAIEGLLANDARRAAMREAAGRVARPDAARTIAEYVVGLAERWRER